MAKQNLLQRLGVAMKAAAIVFGGSGGTAGGGVNAYTWLPGAARDYEHDAGDLWRNSAVMACLAWIWRVMPEARLQVVREESSGEEQPVPRHPLVGLLRRPNAYYSGNALLQATALDYQVDGNAYWLVLNSAAGKPVELWYAPSWMMEPRWPMDGSRFVSHYEYTVDGRRYQYPAAGSPEARTAPISVVHFRYGVDPRNTRKGLAPLKAGLREVAADNLASTYTTAILRNTGAVPGIISPTSPDAEISDEARANLLALYAQRQSGENAGRPLISGGSVKFERMALSPEEMALDRIRQVPEARICSLIGIKAMVAGLSVGDVQRTYNNLKEAQEQSYEGCIIPMHRSFGDDLGMQLLPSLGDAGRERVTWNYSGVRCLQQDMDALEKRAVVGYQGGVRKRSEARAMVGLQYDASDEVYFVEPGTLPEPLPPDEGS